MIFLLVVAGLLLAEASAGIRSNAGSSSAATSSASSIQTSPASKSSTSLSVSTSSALATVKYNLTVPAAFQKNYTSLQQDLLTFSASLNSSQPASAHNTTFAAELLSANANAGPSLLEPGALQTVTDELNALQSMGVQGVTVAIGFPTLYPTYQNSSQYLSFYESVAQMIHSRGMKLDVESSALFANSPFSPVKFNWSALPYSSYVTEHAQMDQTIINDLKPDWLELGVEPDTEYSLTGYTQFSTPSGWSSYIESLLSGLQKGTTKLAAGSATWDGAQYIQGFVTDPRLDAISTHVYPVYGNTFSSLVQIAKEAEANGKPLIIDEAWETKSLGAEGTGGVASDTSIFSRDAYGFWSPIDELFLSDMAAFSRDYNVAYLSPFWSNLFFAYLDYGPSTTGLQYSQIQSLVDHAAATNMTAGLVSPTGAFYARLIDQYGQPG